MTADDLRAAARKREVELETLLAAALCAVLFRYTRAEAVAFSLYGRDDVEQIRCTLGDELRPSELFREIGSRFDPDERRRDLVELSFPAVHEGEQLELRARVSLDERPVVLLEAGSSLGAGVLERMIGHFETVLAALAAESDAPLGRLPLLTKAELHAALVGWNATRAAYREDATLQTLFEEAAARFPDRTALVVGEMRLTYDELNRRANRLAHRLIARGIGPESLVGVLLERTEALIVAILAVLKAGGGYVPLDPANPAARLELILDDAQAEIVLTQASLRRLAGESSSTIDVIAEIDDAYPETNPEPRSTPENVAYVIYTSGSTGKPKGVAIEHRSLAAFIAWTQKAFTERELSGVLLASSIAFDVSVFELFGPLCSGGCAVMVDDILGLASAPARETVRLVSGTAAGLTAISLTTVLPSSVQTVIQAGELMHGTLAQSLYTHPAVERVVNLCGATEDTVYSVSYEVPRGAAENPPIGKPFDNHETYVLDEHLQPVPAGVPGELYYAGLGLAREYVNRPELTRERFLPNPFETSPYPRLYKSGDIVRYRADGDLEYISRSDDQLKIRGYRVEISEIEAQLATHPSIAEVAVAARRSPVGEVVLVAYSVVRKGAALSLATLRQYAAERLPDYMLPSSLVVLKELPRSATGKIDRRGLPEPQFDRPQTATPEPSESGDVESFLVGLWRELLGVESIGVDQNFFELGGHSLIAVRVLARIRERYGVTIGLREFFAAPRISELTEKIDAPAPLPEVTQSALKREATASMAQEQLWFLEGVLPNHAVYNVPVAMRLTGSLDEVALARALDALLARHEQLRAVFPDRDGTPYVDIDASRTIPLDRLDAGGQDVGALIEAAGREPFDLKAGPLVRAHLFRCAADEHVLLLNMHHIISDGWSVGVMYEELLALYDAFSQGRKPSLSALTATFADYALAERSAEGRAKYEAHLGYWTERLAGAARVELPGDRVEPRAPTFAGDRTNFVLGSLTFKRIRELARALGATPSIVLLASYAALIARCTLEDDVVIGMPTAGRPSSELEQLVGYFVGMAPVRIDLSGDPTFRELVERTSVAMLDGLDHQPVPMQMLVERLAPQRSGLKNPLFALSFVAQTDLEPAERAGLRFEMVPAQTKTAKFDLLFEVTEGRDAIACAFEFATDLYSTERVEGFGRALVRLLESGLDDPQQSLHSLAMVGEEERSALLEPPARIESPEAHEPIYRRFERRASQRPDATAIVFGDARMSYGELDGLSERWAGRLRALGAGPGSHVGICAQRSPLVIVAILAVLKSGAAYVPLDPQYPAARLAFITEDAGLNVILADRSSRNVVSDKGATVVDLEEPLPEETAPALEPVSADDPAYLIYTSGSTGLPKGVSVTHRNVARLFAASESVYDFGPGDVWTLFHSYAFDFSVWELWGALAYGGTLVVVPAEIARSPRDFRRLLLKNRVTVLNQTPSAFYALIAAEQNEPQRLDALRYVIFGGEALDVRRLEPWFDRYGEERPALVNMYGITETTVHVTYRRVVRDDATRPFGPIGAPLRDLRIYLLDRKGALVADGAIGEMYVGGDGVASGYLRRDELTRERFLNNPAAPERGERVYRSGDLARRLPDGSYEYVGRNDDQVKIRGFRIELGEIEAALASHPQIERAIVVVDREGEENRLAAYLVLAGASAQLPDDIRTHLSARLPQHMIPAAFFVVREIPLTENGKLDRRALAAAAETPRPDEAAAEPMTPMERKLAGLFAQALGTERVGIDDNFFFLGGHSLLAARLVAAVEAEFPDEVARLRQNNRRSPLLPMFYVDPTVRGLEAALLRARALDGGRMVALRTGSPQQAPLFWLHGMFNGDGLYTWNVVEPLGPDRPVWVIHPHGYDNAPFPADIKALAREQFDLIRSARPHGPYHIGGFCNGALIAYEIAAMLEAEGETVDSLFLVSPPPMIPAMKRLLKLSEQVSDLLHVGPERRVLLDAYLYRYAGRASVFARARGAERWKQLRRGWELTARKFGSLRKNQPVAHDFADPLFKNDWYLRAISSYVPSPYSGGLIVVWGSETVHQLSHSDGGWAQLGGTSRIHYVDGGHFCVVDNPSAVGALLRAGVEGEGDRTAS